MGLTGDSLNGNIDIDDKTGTEYPIGADHRQVDMKAKYGTASILKGSRVVFNIGGNKYRLVVKINYPHQVIYVRFLGTHEEYNDIDAETI